MDQIKFWYKKESFYSGYDAPFATAYGKKLFCVSRNIVIPWVEHYSMSNQLQSVTLPGGL